MARYIIERTFPEGLQIPVSEEGAQACLGVVDRNSELGVTWVHLTSARTIGRRFACTTARTRRPFARRRRRLAYPSIASPGSACWTRTSITEQGLTRPRGGR
jgi:hypothetical protein